MTQCLVVGTDPDPERLDHVGYLIRVRLSVRRWATAASDHGWTAVAGVGVDDERCSRDEV